MAADEDRRATGFGELAEQYDQSRPSYPSQLVDELVDDALRVVDVGRGTGIAARLFLARGCDVLGVEPDVRMADVARCSGIAVIVTRFEDWEPNTRFDLLISGQAWHWVDRRQGSAKAADVLREGGRFAAFWNNYEHVPAALECFTTIYERLAPDLLGSVVLGGRRADDAAGDDRDAEALAATGAFSGIERRSYPWVRSYTGAQWLAELGTHSDHRLLEEHCRRQLFGDLEEAIQQLGDRVDVRLRTGLITALRT